MPSASKPPANKTSVGKRGTGTMYVGGAAELGAGSPSAASSMTKTQLALDGGESDLLPEVGSVPPLVVVPVVGSYHQTFA